ncbi:MAG: glycosyltransferase family A protein [Winogradskyella arenosi]
MPEIVVGQLDTNTRFESALAQEYDLAYKAIQQGYIGQEDCYTMFEPLPLADNYRFIRSYFSPFWVVYVLFVRLLSFYNPIKELKAYLKTRDQQRIVLRPLKEATPEGCPLNTALLVTPKVSVIIPTLNRYRYLKDVLLDLQAQDYVNFEVLVVDQSDPFQAEFYEVFQLDLKVSQQTEKALWLARNTAIQKATSDYLLFFDDDSRVAPDWISKHLKCLTNYNADISSGVSISKVGAKTPADYAYFKVSSQLDTGNALIKRQVFETVGLYDRQFEKQRMGDGEFGLRAYLDNFKNVSNPLAKRLHLKVGSGGLRDMGQWDAFRTASFLDPRPVPSVLYYFRRYYGDSAARWSLLKTVPISIMPYRFKSSKPMMLFGLLVSIFLLPLVCYQVWSAWGLSSKKLEQGPRIEEL